MIETESKILKRLKRNKKINSFWLKLFRKQIIKILSKRKVPSQTIGIFLNPYTSNKERIAILKMKF